MTDATAATRPQRARRSMAAEAPLSPPQVAEAPAPQPALPAVNGNGHAAEPAVVAKVRKPFGSHVQKLQYPPRGGFHRHWFIDRPGRIDRALEAGYAHVKDKDGKNVSTFGGRAEGGGKELLCLMEIPLEWYREDQALKDRKRDQVDAQLKRGAVAGVEPGKDGSYLPMNKSGTVGPDITR